MALGVYGLWSVVPAQVGLASIPVWSSLCYRKVNAHASSSLTSRLVDRWRQYRAVRRTAHVLPEGGGGRQMDEPLTEAFRFD